MLAENKYTTIAGTLVFFLIMSFVPFLFWASLLFSRSGMLINELLELELFGWAKDLITFFQNNAAGATAGAGILFLATTLWSSTGFFYHLRRSGEIIYSHKGNHGWKVRVSAVIVTFLVIIFFVFAGGVILGANLFLRDYPPYVYYPVVYSLVFIFGFFAAWVLNGYVCPFRISPNDTVLGSLFTAIAWLFASAAFSVYLTFTNQERLYGALSLVIVFLLWLYWMMICLTSGVIYNAHRLKDKNFERKKL